MILGIELHCVSKDLITRELETTMKLNSMLKRPSRKGPCHTLIMTLKHFFSLDYIPNTPEFQSVLKHMEKRIGKNIKE